MVGQNWYDVLGMHKTKTTNALKTTTTNLLEHFFTEYITNTSLLL